MLLQLSHISPLCPSMPGILLPSSNTPHLSSCPRFVHISTLASSFPILFLTPPVYYVPTNYATYSLYLLSHSPFLLQVDNPPCDLHCCDSIPVLVVCLGSFFSFLFFSFSLFLCFFLCFFLYLFLSSFFQDSVVNSCEFVTFLMFIVLVFFFLNKSL